MSNRWCWGVNVGSVDIDPGDLIYLDPADRRPVFFGAYSGVRTFKKQEANMKTDKMPQETIAALHKSIAHWNDICYGDDDRTGMRNCAMCQLFYLNEGHCRNCPVPDDCEGLNSVYARYMNATPILADNFCTVDSAEAAEAMLELLVSLLPDGEQFVYDVFECLAFDEWMYKGKGWEKDLIGITTDGRNAFPQAKKVWEKVFEYQVCGPVPEMPSHEWAECPTKWWISTTKDGKCVTCGQVVKKKVTKYKVLCKTYSGEVKVSEFYYISEADFKRQCWATECIHLIKETAKEFDV